MQLNEINFAGNCGQDAQVKATQNGKEIVLLSVCYSRKGRDGAPDESTWVNILASGYLVDVARGIKKGDNVFCSGNLKINKYKDKDGIDRTGVSINARQIDVFQKRQRSEPQEQAPVASSDPFENVAW